VLGGALLLASADLVYFGVAGHIPAFGDIWWLALWVPVFAAAAASSWAAGAALSKRISGGALCGALIGLFYGLSNTLLGNLLIQEGSGLLPFLELAGRIATISLWRIFLFTIVALIGSFIAETRKLRPKMTIDYKLNHFL